MDILKLAQAAALKIVNDDMNLEKEENKLLKQLVKIKFINRLEL